MSTVEHRNEHRNEPLTPDPPSAHRQRRERRAAIGLGIAGLVVAGVALLVPDPAAAEACWTVGFGLLFPGGGRARRRGRPRAR